MLECSVGVCACSRSFRSLKRSVHAVLEDSVLPVRMLAYAYAAEFEHVQFQVKGSVNL